MHVESFFDSWDGLLRIIVIGTIAYVALVTVLRISGKRTLSKMNAFDLVVTVALGSTLATVILSKDVALAEGVLALVLLVALQLIVSWSSVRSKTISRLVKSEPALVYYRGEFLREQMHRARVVEDEVLAAMREQGQASLGDVEAVVLETDGTMSVVMPGGPGRSSLQGVSGLGEAGDA